MCTPARAEGLAAVLALCLAAGVAGRREFGSAGLSALAVDAEAGRGARGPPAGAGALLALASASNGSAAEEQGEGLASEKCVGQPTCGTCLAIEGCKWCSGDAPWCMVAGPTVHLINTAMCTSVPSCPAPPAAEVPHPPEPEKWLLTEAEVLAARGGAPRKQSVISYGNNATLCLTGRDVFREIGLDILQTGPGDHVLLSAFGLVPSLPLLPERPDQSILDDFKEAMERDVRVRVLRQRGIKESLKRQYDFQDQFTSLVPPESRAPNGARSRLILDARMAFPLGSIHQKFTSIKHHGKLHAMVGGIDIDSNRWDVPEHDHPEIRQQLYGNNAGWIDRHVKLEGPGAADLHNSFAERWNSEVPISISGMYKGAALAAWDLYKNGFGGDSTQYFREDPLGREVAPEDYAEPSAEPPQGTVAAQVILTNPHVLNMGDVYSRNLDYAPNGDYTYLAAYLKATHRARSYIYIEDQYGMYMKDLYDALALALERGLGKLVVVYAHTSGVNSLGCAVGRHRMWQPLKDAYPDRVHLLVRKDDVFVHSKIWIVDDMWVAIGSSNIGYRSFTYDPEIGVAMVDTETFMTPDGITAARFVFETRARCISELARVPLEEVLAAKLPDAFAMLWAEGSSLRSVDEVPKLVDSSVTEEVMDLKCSKTDIDGRR